MLFIRSSIAVLLSWTVSASLVQKPLAIFANPPPTEGVEGFRIPTVHESAVQARRILRLESIGTLSTIFPGDVHHTEHRPAEVSGTPIGLMDYFADCEPETGNPTILAIDIATSFKNVAAGSNITLSMRWHLPASKRRRSVASLPRFSLVGYLEDIPKDDVENIHLERCFLKYHRDAAWWLPGNHIHESRWVRLVVEDIYWIGGFGDRAYIGWIPAKEWRSVTEKEIEDCRLPGEPKRISWMSWLSQSLEL